MKCDLLRWRRGMTRAMCNQIVASRGRSGKVDEVMPGSLSADADAFAYCSFWFLARLPASKKPGSDENTRSPRMNPIRKEGVG